MSRFGGGYSARKGGNPGKLPQGGTGKSSRTKEKELVMEVNEVAKENLFENITFGNLTFEIKVDTTELYEALEKYKEIQKYWDDEWKKFKSLESDEARIFFLVSKHGWSYREANHFILRL